MYRNGLGFTLLSGNSFCMEDRSVVMTASQGRPVATIPAGRRGPPALTAGIIADPLEGPDIDRGSAVRKIASKPFARLTGSRGFDGCIQRRKIRLRGNFCSSGRERLSAALAPTIRANQRRFLRSSAQQTNCTDTDAGYSDCFERKS
jgi:hypothetical protein